MKRQRGIADGWFYLIGLIALVGFVYGAVHLVTSYLHDVDAKAYTRGKEETEAAYAQRDNAALKTANETIQRLHTEARAHERDDAQRLATIDQQRAKEIGDAKAKRDRDVADARSGAIGMRDPGQPSRCAATGGLGPGPALKPSASFGDGRTAGQLSRESVQFLLLLADDADDVARQLASAQAVIRQDRVTCGGPSVVELVTAPAR